MSLVEDAKWGLAAWDGCSCGDYRIQHTNGTGQCKMPNDLTHGFKRCDAFELRTKATAIPDGWKGTDLALLVERALRDA